MRSAVNISDKEIFGLTLFLIVLAMLAVIFAAGVAR